MRYFSMMMLLSEDGAVTNHDTLYGVIFGGIVSLILGYMGYRTNADRTRNREAQPTPTPTTAPNPDAPPNVNNNDTARDEILDLRAQRNALQVKYDQVLRGHGIQAVEIGRLRELLVDNDIDPDTGSVTLQDTERPPVDLRRRPRPQ